MAGQGHAQGEAGFAIGARLTRAQLFGDFRFHAPDGMEVALGNRRARALLAMLCVAPEHSISRDTLIRLLWPGRFEAQARASLRQCLLELGKTLEAAGCAILSVTRERIGLVAGRLQTDLGELEQALAVGDVDQVSAIVHGIGTKNLLDEMHLGDGLADWIRTRRDDIEYRLATAIAEAIDRLQRAGNMATAGRLRDAWALRDQHPLAPTRRDDRNRVAVLPFQLYGKAEGADYFVDGVAEELISALGQVPQLAVTGRTSSFHFRDSDLPLAEIATALNVSHVIEGSVQRSGEQVRVHVHLVDGRTGFELWGARYDGTLDAIFRLQEVVAQAVTRAIAAALKVEMPAPQVRGMTHSKEAYDLYLQGRSLCVRIFGDGVLDRAVALFEKALALDPDFAECWVWLAEAHHNISVYTQCLDRNAAAARMAECARRAIALAPDLGYPHAMLGTYAWTQKDVLGALDLAFKAYRLEPQDPAVAMRLASFLIYCGRTRDAVPYIDAAIEQDPVDPRKYALRWGILMGQQAFEAAQAVGQRIVDLGWPAMYLAAASAALGQHELAVEQYQLTKQLVNSIILPPVGSGALTPEAMDAYWLVAAKGVCSGKADDRMVYGQVLAMMAATLHDPGDLAITGPAILTGNADLTFRTLGGHISPANILAFLWLWADVEPVRQIWRHEEFIPFAQRIGMADAWDKYGWPDLLGPPSNL